MRRVAGLLLTVCCLVGCGFHLRGSVTLPPSLKHLYLATNTPYSPLTRILQDNLKFSGVELTKSRQSANLVLQILREDVSQQILTTSTTQQTRQYNLILAVTFQITDPDGNVLIFPQTLSETRVLTMESNQILASSNEAASLYQQMRQAIATDILNRLSSPDITVSLSSQKKHS